LEVLPSVLPTKNGKSIQIAIQMWLFYILHLVLPIQKMENHGKIRYKIAIRGEIIDFKHRRLGARLR
jgi:hypothetical protein